LEKWQGKYTFDLMGDALTIMRSGNSASWGKNSVFTGYRKGGHETKRVTRKLQKEHWD